MNSYILTKSERAFIGAYVRYKKATFEVFDCLEDPERNEKILSDIFRKFDADHRKEVREYMVEYARMI